MPKAARGSLPKHEAAVPVVKAIDQDEDLDMEMAVEDAAGDGASEHVDAEDQNQEEDAEATLPSQPNKKAKQKNKRAALMQKLVESSIPVSPYSKSHNRRQKRKEKQSMGLDSMTAALDDAVPDISSSTLPASSTATSTRPSSSKLATTSAPPPPEGFLAKRSKAENKQLSHKAKTAPNKIGEDTVNKSLSTRQRQKML